MEARNDSDRCSVCATKEKRCSPEKNYKMRILCLHGYRQNALIFKSKLGAFRKQVKKYVDLDFIDAPHTCNPQEDDAETHPNQLSWWFNKDDRTFKGTNKNGPAYGFQESLKHVEETWRNKGPYDGLLGFSQGACFVGLICALSKKKLTSIKPNFAIMASGFLSGSLAHKSAYEELLTIPSLHIIGLTDEIITEEMSMELVRCFKSVELLDHNGGHYFPATSKQKLAYTTFFDDRFDEYMEKLELEQNPNALLEEQQEAQGDTEVQTISDSDCST